MNRYLKGGVLVLLCVLLPLSLTGCKLTKEQVTETYNNVLQAAGTALLTDDEVLKGERQFGADEYTGTYSATYENFDGTECLFGGMSVERESGNKVTVSLKAEAEAGEIQLLWVSGLEDPKVLFEDSGELRQTLELSEGCNYFCLSGENYSGCVALTLSDAPQ